MNPKTPTSPTAPAVKITQLKTLTSKIDWLEVWRDYKSSGLSCRTYFSSGRFKAQVKDLVPEGYLPGLSTFNRHMSKIARLGEQNYRSDGRRKYQPGEWDQIYDEYLASGLGMAEFFRKNAGCGTGLNLKSFYERMGRTRKIREQRTSDAEVRVVVLDDETVKGAAGSRDIPERTAPSDSCAAPPPFSPPPSSSLPPAPPQTLPASTGTCVEILLCDGTLIKVPAASPELTAALIIGNLRRFG